MSYRKKTSYVYFIRARSEFEEYIKVGFAYNPSGRLIDLQVGCPLELELVGVIPEGGYSLEQEIHKDLADDRVRGEWFLVSERILPWLKKLEPPPIKPEAVAWQEPIRIKQIDNGGFYVWDMRTADILGKCRLRVTAELLAQGLSGLSAADAKSKADALYHAAEKEAVSA